MNNPIHNAIDQILKLFGYEERVVIIKDACPVLNKTSGQIWCVVEGSEKAFLEYVSESENLPPLIIIRLNQNDSSPLSIFETLSKIQPFSQQIGIFKNPYPLSDFIKIITNLSAKKIWDNPFKNIMQIKKIFPDISPKDISSLYGKISEIAANTKDQDKNRLIAYHGAASQEARINQHLFNEFCLENIYACAEINKWRGKKILWIENNPDDGIFKIEYTINAKDKQKKHLVTDIFKEFFKYEIELISKPDQIKNCYEGLQEGQEKFKKYDLILIDMFLGEESSLQGLSGKDFLRICSQNFPDKPAIILSSSEDFETISDTIKEGADFYILKKYAVSLPHYFRKSYERLGKLLSVFDDKDKALKQNLVGNLRYWRFHKSLLWFGDKCFHMINHSFDHSMNDWMLLNELMYPIIENTGNKKIFGNDLNLYSLCMAVWLHDIGHHGNERYGTPYEIRDHHGLISGEFVLRHPELLRIYMDDEEIKYIESSYKGIAFPFGSQKKSIVQIIKENAEENKKLYSVEKIALLCIFHQSNAPMSKSDYKGILAKNKFIPIEFYKYSDKNNEIITLDSILHYLNEGVEKQNFKRMVSILRFVDAIDIRQNRVGVRDEKIFKMAIIEQDKNYLMERLKKEILTIKQRYSNDNKLNMLSEMTLLKIFYQDVVDKIKHGDSISQFELLDLMPEIEKDMDNYFLLARYGSFISVQDGHFDLHSAIDKVEIKYCGTEIKSPYEIEIIFTSNLEMKKLRESKVVRDAGEKDKATISSRLLGTESSSYKNGYILKDYLSGDDSLKNIIKLSRITLCSKIKVEDKTPFDCVSYDQMKKSWVKTTERTKDKLQVN